MYSLIILEKFIDARMDDKAGKVKTPLETRRGVLTCYRPGI